MYIVDSALKMEADSTEANERKPHMTSCGSDSVQLRADG
jgi:hypothetical protein